MAYVKVKWRKDIPKDSEQSAEDYEKYLLKERGSELMVNVHNCPEGKAIEKFKSTQALHGKDTTRGHKSTNIAFEVIQSFSPAESKTLTTEKINFMGTELAKRFYPDHEFMVVTHTDTIKSHNHILINPVNEITGKRDITDKKQHLYNLRGLSNEISRENGLSVIAPTDKAKEKLIPHKVREIQKRGGKSYRMDLFQKADFARSYSTSFDEYTSILNELSVNVATTDKNITYFYTGHSKGIRGNKLGTHYDKSGLADKFKENDQLFNKQPQLRSKIRDGITDFKNGKGDSVGVSSSLLLGGGTEQNLKDKDYESFTKSDRRGNRTPHPSDNKLVGCIIPISEIRKASNSDIFEYCDKHKIKTETNKKGQTVLSGRSHVVLNNTSWTNTRNKTAGSLIELVTVHDDSNYLKAISKITGNKNLLLLEQYFGEVKRPYTSFYVPKAKQEKPLIAQMKLNKFLKHHGINEKHSDDLLKLKKAQVDSKGSIWLFSEENNHEASEFIPEKDGYKQKRHGDSSSPFSSSSKNGKSVEVFSDIISFLKVGGAQSHNSKNDKSQLVLMGLDEKAMHIFLAKNPQTKVLNFIESPDKMAQMNQWNFIDKLKKDLGPLSISVTTTSHEKAIKKDRGLGLDI